MESKRALELDRLRAEVTKLSADAMSLQSQLVSGLDASGTKLSQMREQLSEISTFGNVNIGIPEIRGRRTPKWYELNIPFAYGETRPQTASVEVSNNPFICTQIQPFYLITDEDPTHFPLANPDSGGYPNGSFATTNAAGRMLPCSAFSPLIQYESIDRGGPAVVDVLSPAAAYRYIADIFSSYESGGDLFRGLGWNYPELDFEIQIQGSGRYWTGGKVPAPAFYGVVNPLYLGYEGFVDTSDRFIVTAHPTTQQINTQGIVRFVFFGYEISTSLTLSDVFGY
jgi:hypothetical protein